MPDQHFEEKRTSIFANLSLLIACELEFIFEKGVKGVEVQLPKDAIRFL